MSMFGTSALQRCFAAVTLVGVLSTAAACGSRGAASVPRPNGPESTAVTVEANQAKEQRIALAEEAIRNGRYELPAIGAFQLKDGSFQEKYGEGATQVNRAGVVTVAFGDLDDDKVEDTAVVLWANTGGSGTFIYLAPVLNQDGKGQQAGVQLLGDRVQIKSLTIDSGKIRVEVLAQGPKDPMVSPSLQSTQEYTLQGGTLVSLTTANPTTAPVSPTQQATQRPASQPSLPSPTAAPRPTEQPASKPALEGASGLTGAIWIWQGYVDGGDKGSFAVPYPAAYRLELLPVGTYSVQADCNRGSGSYSTEGSRLALRPGPMTLAECQQGSRSKEFMRMLEQAGTYVLTGDALYLNLAADSGTIVFSRLGAVTGRIMGPAGAAIPSGSAAEIMVVDSTGARIGGWMGKAQLPMEFEAPFKPANIDPSASFALEVKIRDAQKKLIFKNSRPYPVLTQGNPTYHLDVQVERVE